MSAPTTPRGETRRRPRRRTLLVGLLLVVVLAVAADWLVQRSRPQADAHAATETPLPPAGTYGDSVLDPSSAAPTRVPGNVVATAPGMPKALTPVGLAAPVAYSDGVTARVVDIKAVTAHAHLPGETSGPALAVIIELTNSPGQAVSLDTVAVNLYLGTEGKRAARIQADSGAPFSGTLAAGASAKAVYAFNVPEDQRNAVTITVGHSPETGTAVFSGSVG